MSNPAVVVSGSWLGSFMRVLLQSRVLETLERAGGVRRAAFCPRGLVPGCGFQGVIRI